MTEDEMVGWHHRRDGHEFEQAVGVGDGQGSLVYCSPWGCKELGTTERQNCTERNPLFLCSNFFLKASHHRIKSKGIGHLSNVISNHSSQGQFH